MRRTVRFRSLAPVAVLALVSAFAAGCGDDGDKSADDQETIIVDQDGNTISPDGGDDEAVAPLTADQVGQAVLQDDNLGTGWTSKPYTEDEDPAPGCLADIDTLTEGLTEQAKGGTEFSYGDALTVESTVSAFPDATALGAVFDQVQVALAACTSVTDTDDEGNAFDLTLAASDDAVYEGLDDQYSVSGNGTVTAPDGTSVDIYIEQTAVRIGPNVASISTFDLESRGTEHVAWTQIAVDRLKAVVAGEEPPATTAPAPA